MSFDIDLCSRCINEFECPLRSHIFDDEYKERTELHIVIRCKDFILKHPLYKGR